MLLKLSPDRLVIIAKEFLKLPNLCMLIKQKSPLLPRNLVLVTFGELLIVLSAKVNKSAIPPLFNGLDMLSSACDKAKLCAKKLF